MNDLTECICDLGVADAIEHLIEAMVPASDAYIACFPSADDDDVEWHETRFRLMFVAEQYCFGLTAACAMIDQLWEERESLSPRAERALSTTDYIYPNARLLLDSLLLLSRVSTEQRLLSLPRTSDVPALGEYVNSDKFATQLRVAANAAYVVRTRCNARIRILREGAP